eukprot:3152104-Amphidinium_carterae.1
MRHVLSIELFCRTVGKVFRFSSRFVWSFLFLSEDLAHSYAAAMYEMTGKWTGPLSRGIEEVPQESAVGKAFKVTCKSTSCYSQPKEHIDLSESLPLNDVLCLREGFPSH